MSYTPLFFPLNDGLDQSRNPVNGGTQLTLAENVDFAVAGEVRARPGRAQPQQFICPDPSVYLRGGTNNPYLAATAFANTGYTKAGLLNLREPQGEGPALATYGELFSYDEDRATWRARGQFGCMAVDRPYSFGPQSNSNAMLRGSVGPNFVINGVAIATVLGETDLDFQAIRTPTNMVNHDADGTAAKAGTYAGMLYSVASNKLYLAVRVDGSTAITGYQLATDLATVNSDGDAPCLCSNADGTLFYAVYQTTTANQYKVLKITPSNGTVTATYTGTLAGIWGHWVAASSVSDNVVVVGLTNTAGVTLKVLNATTMGDNAKDSTHGAANYNGREVVVGIDSASRAWWAYHAEASSSINRGLYIGTCNPGTAASGAALLTYLNSCEPLGTAGDWYKAWTPMHQPVRLNGRTYLTIGEVDDFNSIYADVGTWYTIDLTSLYVAGSSNGSYIRPTVVARGLVEGTAFRPTYQPEGAIPITNGWTFPTLDWLAYGTSVAGLTTGQMAHTVINRVTLSKPRATTAGVATYFSGSVPRILAGDMCNEMGWAQTRPLITATNHAGGGATNPIGTYTFYACWVWTDGAGQIHRSCPSAGVQATTVGANDYVQVRVSLPQITERELVQMEIYATAPGASSTSLAYLQDTVNITFGVYGAQTYLAGFSKAITTGTQSLYTSAGEFLHMTPNADGGVATLGRRVWTADYNTVYASLLLQPGQPATWNDEGSLSVSMPAGAGRILSIEPMDDKMVVLCERGVFYVQDGGPDNAGNGPDLAFPIRLSDLGVAGPRSSCVTDRGVVFCSPLDSVDPQRGGPWLLDRNLSLTERQYLGNPTMNYWAGNGSFVPEVAFSPERQQCYVTVPVADSDNNSGVVCIDMRMGKWSTWSAGDSFHGSLASITVSGGCLWDARTEVAGYTVAPGNSYSETAYMRIRTVHIPGNGQDGLGWSRVRSVSVLGGDTQASAYQLIVYATLDRTRTYNSTFNTVPAPATVPGGTWPSATRPEVEWRLPDQKCGTIQITLQGNFYAKWSAIRLDVAPLPGRGPSSVRQ